jgi:hypothetical protein
MGYCVMRYLITGFPSQSERSLFAILVFGAPPVSTKIWLVLLVSLFIGLLYALLAGLSSQDFGFASGFRMAAGRVECLPRRRAHLGIAGGVFRWWAFGVGAAFGLVWSAIVFLNWATEYPVSLLRGVAGATLIVLAAYGGALAGSQGVLGGFTVRGGRKGISIVVACCCLAVAMVWFVPGIVKDRDAQRESASAVPPAGIYPDMPCLNIQQVPLEVDHDSTEFRYRLLPGCSHLVSLPISWRHLRIEGVGEPQARDGFIVQCEQANARPSEWVPIREAERFVYTCSEEARWQGYGMLHFIKID